MGKGTEQKVYHEGIMGMRRSQSLHELSPITDETGLLAGMAPHLGINTTPDAIDAAECDAAVAGAAGLAHCRDPDGEEQTDLGPVDGLRRLRCRDQLRRPLHHR